nr:MAG TPA: Minor capsid protein [Caudoviricetes sp.]
MSDFEFKINLKRMNGNIKKAQAALINQIRIDTEQYVPALDLTLSNSAHAENKNTELVYNGPYARFQYYGKVMVDERGSTYARPGGKKHVINKDLVYTKDRHPNATSFWYKKAKERYKDKWVKLVKDVVKNG